MVGRCGRAKVSGFFRYLCRHPNVRSFVPDSPSPYSFRTRVDAATLSHHRIKLFPASTSQADRLAQRLAPAPSPFKARSLLSLEKSARKREIKAGEQRVADSPTMKRLLRGAELAAAQQGSDTFKVPKAPRSRGGDDQNESSQPRIAGEKAGRRPRDAGQLDRSRPLPRGDSTAGATEVLQRRVVSMNKKPRSAATAPKRPGPAAASVPVPVDDGEGEVVMRKRKRKSLSPKSTLVLHLSVTLQTLTLATKSLLRRARRWRNLNPRSRSRARYSG